MGAVGDRELLGVVVALGCGVLDAVRVAGAALGRPDAVEALSALDGVVVGDDRMVFPTMSGVQDLADPALVERAGSAVGAFLVDRGELVEAGRLAVTASLVGVMRATVRNALRVQPPRVVPAVLRQWRDAGVLPPADAHAAWLGTVCSANGLEDQLTVIAHFEAVRQAFEDAGDVEAEVSVGLAMATQARRADDLATLFRLVARAEDLVAAGHHEALAPAVLGRTLGHQFAGAPELALAELEQFPADRLEGDWSAQVAMIRGANLMLLGRSADAVDALSLASGHGSEWTFAVALELMGTARWHVGDAVGAIEDLRWAQVVARRAGASGTARLAEAHAAAMVAADGRPAEPPTNGLEAAAARDEEIRRLLAVAAVLRSLAEGDRERATDLAAELPMPGRVVRSAAWVVALRAALLGDDAVPGDLTRGAPAMVAALEAGRAGAAHLAGGPPAPVSARVSLPASWCSTRPPTIEVLLLGDALIRRDGCAVAHRDWDRARARELCLHLALVSSCSREQVAADLWPDLDTAAAGRNLRVTLTYLSNVLDPDRQPGGASDLIDTRAGRLTFADTARLRIDVREAATATAAIRDGAGSGDDATLVRGARALLRHPRSDLLGGAVDAAWVEHHDRLRREAILGAARVGALRLVRLGHHELGEDLARRGLDEDPWAERLHQAVVRACLARDDLDAARRSLRAALAALDDLGVRPEQTTVELAELVGMTVER